MKLFAIYVGGEAPGANIELHDMRFVAAPSIGDTHEALRRQWWGTPASLHIDCWAEISHADGYDVLLQTEPFSGPERLYYVNLGGYDRSQFTEQHRNAFVVAAGVREAKARAIELASGWALPHRDDMYEAEQAFALDEQVAGARLHIALVRAKTSRPFRFTCDYKPIGVKVEALRPAVGQAGV